MPLKETRMNRRLRRYLDLMKQKGSVTTRELQKYCGEKVSLRTVQNDLRYLREHWEHGEIISEHGKHRLKYRSQKEAAEGLDEEKKIYLKLALEATKKMNDFSEPKEELEERLGLRKLESTYYVKAETYEELDTDDELIRELDMAIREDHPVIFEYEGERYHVDPLRLVNFDGIWYLYGFDKEEAVSNPWKTWLLKGISGVEIVYSERHDISDEEAEEDLEEAPSPYFVPDRKIPVLLRVEKEAEELFLLKEHLPDQEKVGACEDGALKVRCVASTYEDIADEIKRWLPHLRILEPREWQERILEELEEYLERVRGPHACGG